MPKYGDSHSAPALHNFRLAQAAFLFTLTESSLFDRLLFFL